MFNTKFDSAVNYDLNGFSIVCDCIGNVVFIAEPSASGGYYLVCADPSDNSEAVYLLTQRGYLREFRSLDSVYKFCIERSRAINFDFQFIVSHVDVPD